MYNVPSTSTTGVLIEVATKEATKIILAGGTRRNKIQFLSVVR